MIHKDKSLPNEVLDIIRRKATERPYSGAYEEAASPGTYLCRGCGIALFRASAQFNAGCGWASFDDALTSAVAEKPDADGLRREIVCARCEAHLGHVFDGEGFTAKNRRHCVNSRSLDFVKRTDIMDTCEAIVAGGCFWGVEYYLAQLQGVLATEVGYTGGHTTHPTYNAVCSGTTGHFEAVRILYDPLQLSYEALLRFFFEIHDPAQTDGQGPDRGAQYQSAVFYYDDTQKQSAEHLITILKKTMPVATQIRPMTPFWSAESDHQHYYAKKAPAQPYCHAYTKRFHE